MKIEFGQKIKFDVILQRSNVFKTPVNERRSSHHKVWRTAKRPNSEGIVIGVRTLSNGINTHPNDAPTEYRPYEYFKALLVVSNLKEKPVLIPYPASGIEADTK